MKLICFVKLLYSPIWSGLLGLWLWILWRLQHHQSPTDHSGRLPRVCYSSLSSSSTFDLWYLIWYLDQVSFCRHMAYWWNISSIDIMISASPIKFLVANQNICTCLGTNHNWILPVRSSSAQQKILNSNKNNWSSSSSKFNAVGES